ncbi:Spectrin alpha chain, non-erythrocytic 1 [Oopsacas minuta]|uniref:Spectrin alpha chain, non-erythrocytic 1 n=1 Tax=Oopsacas minuta TaxID=111878 RepID=A0AAV7KM31_9METZ|nr:Spectrin alpha chain, non-erythrocytic 1 [Oopsacas minuta]
MNASFDLFSHNISNRALQLRACNYFQRFLTEQRDLLFWITSLQGQIHIGELSLEISGAEALLMRIEELKIEIYAREDNYNSVYNFGLELVQDVHFSKQEISTRLDELKSNWLELNDAYHSQESKVSQLLALLIYFRDVEQCENWISLKNTFISNIESDVSLDGVHLILRNVNELSDSLLIQDDKVSGLQESATTLIQSRHYASAVIAEKRVDILQKWKGLKALVSDKREDVVYMYSLHQFLLDAADIEGWISEKCETCVSDSFKTSTYTSIEHFCNRQETSKAEV